MKSSALGQAELLMSYSVSYANLFFRVATFVDKIFKGASPAELPVEQPTLFELVINIKATSPLLGRLGVAC
jgi:putative tryptophan/tyrosine transport system substrate-binding protein